MCGIGILLVGCSELVRSSDLFCSQIQSVGLRVERWRINFDEGRKAMDYTYVIYGQSNGHTMIL